MLELLGEEADIAGLAVLLSLLAVLTGEIRPDRGEALLNGRPLAAMRAALEQSPSL